MEVFNLDAEKRFEIARHVERVLSKVQGGDVGIACWEPGQISPDHCHPRATEIYFCFTGGGRMRTPSEEIAVEAGSFVIHPPGEVHEYENGAARTLFLRIRIGDDMTSHHRANRSIPGWTQRAEDAAYYAQHPPR